MDSIDLGSAPWNETCASVGDEDYCHGVRLGRDEILPGRNVAAPPAEGSGPVGTTERASPTENSKGGPRTQPPSV